MKRPALVIIFILLVMALAGCGRSIVATEPAPTPEISNKLLASLRDTDEISGVPQFNTEEHIAYLKPIHKYSICPDEPITRADACEALYALTSNPVEGSCSFSDVDEKDDYYEALCCLCAWGVISDSQGEFKPEDMLSRAQLMTMLSAYYPPVEENAEPYVGSFLRRTGTVARLPEEDIPSFTDIGDHWAREAIENAVSRGWIEAGGKFYPDAAVTRGEFCHILNRVLGRSGDTAVALVSGEYNIFKDLAADNEYFGDILEAACEHEYYYEEQQERWQCPALEPGFHRVGGRLYYVLDDGTLMHNDTLEPCWDFGPDGSYTTGYDELDETLCSILVSLGTDDMSDEQALRKAYLYCTKNFVYIYHNWKTYDFDGVRSEFVFRARRFFESGGGYCYDFAAGFGYLARSLGYNAYIVKAQINQYYAPHGFVVIPENGVNYIYDTEMEATRQERHADFGLYKITNGSIYNYWYTPWW